MKLDSAVAKILAINDPSTASISSAGGGGCSSASTAKITWRRPDGTERHYFMKTARGKDAQVMLKGEQASLAAIHNFVPSLCPRAYGYGHFSNDPEVAFLVTDFLNLSPRRRDSASSRSAPSLAAKLAKLHTTPAPVPYRYHKPMFGFPVTTCCGDTPQDNTFTESWAEFYANCRLRHILSRCSADGELSNLVETTASKVVPRLLADGHLGGIKGITPVVVHGDLWSGNASKGVIGDGDVVEDVVYDPSACYGHNEFELGIMKMFGGFGGSFLKEYHDLCPKTEPIEEYEDRVALYELYHHLNHYALFGGGYRSGAVSIMRELIRKYGKDK